MNTKRAQWTDKYTTPGWKAGALGLLCAGFFIVGGQTAEPIEPKLRDIRWLDQRSDRLTALTSRPAEPVNYDPQTDWNLEYELGRIAFRSPVIFGGFAAREGLTCQICHTNGYANRNFFMESHSSRPGTFDTTSAVFSKTLGDNTFNPIEIPDLVNVANTAPYGHDGREPSLRAFTLEVITQEFSGKQPTGTLIDALLAYMNALQPRDKQTEPITLEEDLKDTSRGLRVLIELAEGKNADGASFVIASLRYQLAGIAERFPFEHQRKTYSVLVSWSRDLQRLNSFAIEGKWEKLAQRAVRLSEEVEEVYRRNSFVSAGSLYEPETLKKWLKPLEQ